MAGHQADAQLSQERIDYPTQKPEQLLERIIRSSSNGGDIVLDAFVGSGSTPATAEKLNRRWVGIDCGRLSIYATQKRLLNLISQIGGEKSDTRREYERVDDFAAHSKSGSKAALLLFDKARNGELAITDGLLTDFAKFLTTHLPPRRGQTLEFSLLIPEDKLQLHKLKAIEGEDLPAGTRAVDVGGVRFLISFIEPRARAERPQPLKAKHFALFNAGVYDRDKLRALDWARYKPFVMQLFGVRDDPHPIRAFRADGFIGTDSVHVWNYPDQPTLAVDEGYVQSLHDITRGEAGDKFYVIAPVSALTFMSDELIAHAELFDGFLKNADSGFYWFPYSYKSAVRATSHAKTENFNPDFLLKLAGRDVVLVVEIKSDDDDSARNKAKLRDAKEHFAKLNEKLDAAGEVWRYHFYFLPSADYGTFFEAMRAGRLGFKSSLMNQLEGA